MKKIQLTRGYEAIVDNEEYEILSKYKWKSLVCKNTVYAVMSRASNYRPLMHRFILSLEKENKNEVDHINNNGLDNRKSNLRICTSSQNKFNTKKRIDNTSGFKGVCWCKSRKRWIAQIQKDGKHYRIGRFKNKIDAAVAYDNTANDWFGEYAQTNFNGGVPSEL